jgi:hypothetical protein
MPGQVLRLPFAVLACAFGFLGCVMILARGPSAAILWVALKCADGVEWTNIMAPDRADFRRELHDDVRATPVALVSGGVQPRPFPMG